jgi:hypothetical protein
LLIRKRRHRLQRKIGQLNQMTVKNPMKGRSGFHNKTASLLQPLQPPLPTMPPIQAIQWIIKLRILVVTVGGLLMKMWGTLDSMMTTSYLASVLIHLVLMKRLQQKPIGAAQSKLGDQVRRQKDLHRPRRSRENRVYLTFFFC